MLVAGMRMLAVLAWNIWFWETEGKGESRHNGRGDQTVEIDTQGVKSPSAGNKERQEGNIGGLSRAL